MGRTERVVVVGAGVGGLAAAIDLARAGFDVTVVERSATPGGKMREVDVAGSPVDSGPTVLTMKWVFEALFADAGGALTDYVKLSQAEILARHAWTDAERLDLYADPERTADEIGTRCGLSSARAYRAFSGRARDVYETLESSFISAPRPSPVGLMRGVGLSRLWRIKPFDTLWRELATTFEDPRLRQLYGRYATYVGSSPYAAPATLALIAHVEMQGVWFVAGGMQRLAEAMVALAEKQGATFRFGEPVDEVRVDRAGAVGVTLDSGERIDAERVVLNADVATIASGQLGTAVAKTVPNTPVPARSLSALTFSMRAETTGFPLVRHNVFFSSDYAAEFFDLFDAHRLPGEPTVYVCAQDRHDEAGPAPGGPERLFCIVNAPPTGDVQSFDEAEIESCAHRAFGLLRRCGLSVERAEPATIINSPADFARRFPGTGGALYGRATHGPMASFSRPGTRTRIPGLYLAGGSIHPGAGVPMATLSGRLAAASVREDQLSMSPWARTAMSGGTSMR